GRILNFLDLSELRRMEAQVKQAERLAVIGGVAAAVAHEIRDPLASISGAVELLRPAPPDTQNPKLMDIVPREVDRLHGLVHELLDYARPRERLTMPVELVGVLDETVRVFAQDRTQAGVQVALELSPGAESARVLADPAQLRQVVWNLLRNAAEAMPEGGTVRVGLAREGRRAVLPLTDDGIGIGPEEMDHIFEPFFTTKRRGTGLGLPMVHRIITEHGGQVAVESKPGRGTTVRVRLPHVTLASAAAALAPHGERGATETAR